MDVYVRWAKREAKCRYCQQMIEHGKPEVVCHNWRKGSGERKFNITMYFHFPDCWVMNAWDYLNKNPYFPSDGRGRPPLLLAEDDRRRRFLLLRRYAATQHRIRIATDDDQIEHLIEVLDQIIEEIRPVGGVPKKWLEEQAERIGIMGGNALPMPVMPVMLGEPMPPAPIVPMPVVTTPMPGPVPMPQIVGTGNDI